MKGLEALILYAVKNLCIIYSHLSASTVPPYPWVYISGSNPLWIKKLAYKWTLQFKPHVVQENYIPVSDINDLNDSEESHLTNLVKL